MPPIARTPFPHVLHHVMLLSLCAAGDLSAADLPPDAAGVSSQSAQHVTAWAAVYTPTGNDVNENKLLPLFVACEGLRSTFSPAHREQVDDWIARLGDLHAEAVRSSKHYTNRYAKHVRLLALFGRILDRDDWRQTAKRGFENLVTNGLRADGPALYNWTSPSGSSLRKSVDYVVPYANGTNTREEWRHTKVDLDRRRAAAGLKTYLPGRLFNPAQALELLIDASLFDPTLKPLVQKLSNDSLPGRYANWTPLINSVLSEDVTP